MRRSGIALGLLCVVGCATRPPFAFRAEVRGLLIRPSDCADSREMGGVVSNAGSVGVNALILEGAGEPLSALAAESHRLGLSCYAWITTRQEDPSDHRQAVDQEGRPVGWLNPRLFSVREWMRVQAFEAVRKGADGLILEAACPGSHDDVSLNLFGFASGGDPESRPREWDRFWEIEVSALLLEARQAAPRSILIAAAAPTAEERAKLHQNVPAWEREGMVDALVLGGPPSAETRGMRFLLLDVEDSEKAAAEIREGRLCGARGFVLDGYGKLFPLDEARRKRIDLLRNALK